MTQRKQTNVRLTPTWLLTLARDVLGGAIDIDPCTEPDNPTGATVWYTERKPAPEPWPPGATWVNPPWGSGELLHWARKAMMSGNPLLFMTPNDPRTKWFKYLQHEADFLIILTCSVKCYAPELERDVEPSRGVYLWSKGLPRARLSLFEDLGHLVLPLARV